jgi:hypothetical protein
LLIRDFYGGFWLQKIDACNEILVLIKSVLENKETSISEFNFLKNNFCEFNREKLFRKIYFDFIKHSIYLREIYFKLLNKEICDLELFCNNNVVVDEDLDIKEILMNNIFREENMCELCSKLSYLFIDENSREKINEMILDSRANITKLFFLYANN